MVCVLLLVIGDYTGAVWGPAMAPGTDGEAEAAPRAPRAPQPIPQIAAAEARHAPSAAGEQSLRTHGQARAHHSLTSSAASFQSIRPV